MISSRRHFVLISVMQFALVSPAMAGQRAHRPWLMIGGKHRASEPGTPAASVKKTSSQSTPAVKSSSGKTGFVHTPEAEEPVDPRPSVHGTGDKVVEQALKYKGTRYKFGGTTKKGLDCSGLVSRIYDDLKLKRIPRASSALYNSGAPVPLADLRPGDLVFFKNTYRRGISHVGIYAGHNTFVHASNHKRGVTVTPLSDPYYQLHYAGARRLY